MAWATEETLGDVLGMSLAYPAACLRALSECYLAHRDDSVTVPGRRWDVDVEGSRRSVYDVVDWVESDCGLPVWLVESVTGPPCVAEYEGRRYSYVITDSGDDVCLSVMRHYGGVQVDGWMCPSPTAAAVDIWRIETGRLLLEDEMAIDIVEALEDGERRVFVTLNDWAPNGHAVQSVALTIQQVRELAARLSEVTL